MKRITAVLIILGLLVTSGCSGSDNPSVNDKSPEISAEEGSGEKPLCQKYYELNREEKLKEMKNILKHTAETLDTVVNGHIHGDPELGYYARIYSIRKDYIKLHMLYSGEIFSSPSKLPENYWEIGKEYQKTLRIMDVEYPNSSDEAEHTREVEKFDKAEKQMAQQLTIFREFIKSVKGK